MQWYADIHKSGTYKTGGLLVRLSIESGVGAWRGEWGPGQKVKTKKHTTKKPLIKKAGYDNGDTESGETDKKNTKKKMKNEG